MSLSDLYSFMHAMSSSFPSEESAIEAIKSHADKSPEDIFTAIKSIDKYPMLVDHLRSITAGVPVDDLIKAYIAFIERYYPDAFAYVMSDPLMKNKFSELCILVLNEVIPGAVSGN